MRSVTRSAQLRPDHYASQWPPFSGKEGDKIPVSVTNELGIRLANTPDGPEREEILFTLVKSFHNYLMKYVDMIVRGHVPYRGRSVRTDARKFLSLWIPKGQKIDKATLRAACKNLHLAFRGMDPTDIYDTMVVCLIRAMKRYDPGFVDKVKKVTEAVNHEFRQKQFSADDITGLVGFDSSVCVRMFVRRGLLASIRGTSKKVVGYRCTNSWPPPKKLFQSGPVGFLYMVQIWFRYYLQEYITSQMGTIEVRKDPQQLDALVITGDDVGFETFEPNAGRGSGSIPHADGEVKTVYGSYAADTTLMNLPLDLPRMDMPWVQGTRDKLFKDLSRQERYLLYLRYVEAFDWSKIGRSLRVSSQTAQHMHAELLLKLQDKARPCPRP